MFQVYVCVCALGHNIKCVYHGHNKSVKNPALQVCTYLGLSFLEANEKREDISYTIFAAHFLKEEQFSLFFIKRKSE